MSGPAGQSSGTLHGLRIIEVGTSVAAPMATQILGDLGAEVVKVERVGHGDDSRSWAPPEKEVPRAELQGPARPAGA